MTTVTVVLAGLLLFATVPLALGGDPSVSMPENVAAYRPAERGVTEPPGIRCRERGGDRGNRATADRPNTACLRDVETPEASDPGTQTLADGSDVGPRPLLRCLLGGSWQPRRTSACLERREYWSVIDQTGETTGGFVVNVTGRVETDPRSTAWTLTVDTKLEPRGTFGTGVGTTIIGAFTCSEECEVADGGAASLPKTMTTTSTVRNAGRFEVEPIAPGGVAAAETEFSWSYGNPAWAFASDRQSTEPPLVRCDNAVTERPNNVPGTGCVHPDGIPVLSYSSQEFPSFTGHLRQAQASGLPGSPDDAPLTRVTDPARIGANRDTACPRQERGGPVRTPLRSCDEYPFASSREGAASGGRGRTFDDCGDTRLPRPFSTGPEGYSVCIIDDEENRLAGRRLQALYDDNRLFDGEQFYVGVDLSLFDVR